MELDKAQEDIFGQMVEYIMETLAIMSVMEKEYKFIQVETNTLEILKMMFKKVMESIILQTAKNTVDHFQIT